MNGRVAKQLRRMAAARATDNRGLQYSGGTAYHPRMSARALYRRFKKMHARGGS